MMIFSRFKAMVINVNPPIVWSPLIFFSPSHISSSFEGYWILNWGTPVSTPPSLSFPEYAGSHVSHGAPSLKVFECTSVSNCPKTLSALVPAFQP